MTKLRKNEKGLVEGILVVIIILIVLIGVVTVMFQAKRVSVQNELQGMVDNAAIGALVKSVDDVAVMDEDFGIDPTAVRANFDEIFNRAMNETSRGFIENTVVKKFRVHVVNAEGSTGNITTDTAVGDTRQEGGRYQAFVEVVMQAEYPKTDVFGGHRRPRIRYHNILNNADETFIGDVESKNRGIVLVRSIERVVLR